MLRIEHEKHRQEKKNGNGKVCLSVECNGDEQQTPVEHQIGVLEQQHRTLANYYLTKIKEMGETIRQQAEAKEQLTKQIHYLAQQTYQQHQHITALSSKYQQTIVEGKSQQHMDMVSSAYLISKPAFKPEAKTKNGKCSLFTSEKLRSNRLKASKSESGQDGDYFQHKMFENVGHRLKLAKRQSQRTEN